MITFRSLEEFDQDHGTVRLLDASQRYKHKGNSDIVLVPQPTDDPNDPLNWSPTKKGVAFVSAGAFALMSGWVVGGISSGILLLMDEFQTDLNASIDGIINWPVLMLGVGVFWWVPTVQYLGLRPSALLAGLVTFVGCIWGAKSNSFKSLEASRIICTWGVSCAEILPGILVRDLFFLHERGKWMGYYMVFFQCLPGAGLIASGFLITARGWRWFFWLMAIVSGAILLGMFFFLPETQYPRPQTSSAIDHSEPSKELSANLKDSASVHETAPATTRPKKSYLQQLNPWSGINPNGEKAGFLSLFFRPWPLVFYPAVAYASYVFGLDVFAVVISVAESPAVFQSPPYNFTPGIQSLQLIAMLIGSAIGCVWGGIGTDIIAKYQSSKNNGFFEPESRLILMIGPLLIVPAGLLMYGWGCAEKAPWALAWTGAGCIAFGTASIPAITIAYAVDCYYPAAPEVINLIVGLKNVIGFGFSYAVVPWITNQGFKKCFGAMAGIMFGSILLGVALYIYGKQLRTATAKWKVITW